MEELSLVAAAYQAQAAFCCFGWVGFGGSRFSSPSISRSISFLGCLAYDGIGWEETWERLCLATRGRGFIVVRWGSGFAWDVASVPFGAGAVTSILGE